jgi:hypothetical protein
MIQKAIQVQASLEPKTAKVIESGAPRLTNQPVTSV